MEEGEGPAADAARVRFAVGTYDRTKPLVIDPTTNVPSLAFSTLIGGAEADDARAIDIDHAGNAYAAGETISANFPATPGTFDTSKNGNTDAFLLKLNPSGTGLLYSTFIGGDQEESPFDLRVDASGNAYLAGYAVPHPTVNYPTTIGAFDTSHNGGDADAFVTKLNSNGSALLYSTFLGGSGTEEARGLALDGEGNAYIAGRIAQSPSNFPVTQGAFDTTANGGSEAFITKLNAAGSALSYSTFIGGSGGEYADGIEVDQSGNAVITGNSNSTAVPYPTTAGAYDTTHNGNGDVVVTKLNAAGSALIYSTFIGGGGGDNGYDIALDASGNAYITGTTNQNAVVFPTTTGAWDTSPNGTDGFVSKLNAAGSALSYSTFIGGVNFDEANGIAVDEGGNAIITGRTFFDAAAAYPTTPGAFASQHSGNDDAFLTKFNVTGSSLIYSTFLGGGGADAGVDVALDTSGNAMAAGYGGFSAAIQFPASAWAFDTSQNGGTDAFISKISFARQLANNFNDFNGDGRSDFAVTRNTGAQLRWHMALNGPGTYQAIDWGFNTDYLVPADYDGDGKADIAVWRPGAPGLFYILNSSNGTVGIEPLGQTDDNPGVTGDYDGDGKADPAVYRRGATAGAQSFWLYRGSLNPSHVTNTAWGIRGDTVAAGDYDGDGKNDFVVKRITGGQAYFWRKLSASSNDVVQFGIQGDVAYPGDYDGDGKTDLAIVRVNGTAYEWWIRPSSTSIGSFATEFGRSGDFVAQGDYDGDGKTDMAVWRPSDSTYYAARSSSAYRSFSGFKWGLATDFPIGGSSE